jgi:hypothetical protein
MRGRSHKIADARGIKRGSKGFKAGEFHSVTALIPNLANAKPQNTQKTLPTEA